MPLYQQSQMAEGTFSRLSDDIILKIISHLEDDPRYWARLSSVCKKFSSLISTICYKSKCMSAFPSISSDVPTSTSSLGGSWATLYKLSVCCPGLVHAGVLLDSSDFGLCRDIGANEEYNHSRCRNNNNPATTVAVAVAEAEDEAETSTTASSSSMQAHAVQELCLQHPEEEVASHEPQNSTWTLYDDLYFDTLYNNSEIVDHEEGHNSRVPMYLHSSPFVPGGDSNNNLNDDPDENEEDNSKKRKRNNSSLQGSSHLASGVWNLSREQGNKLLASRFKGDCLYISDSPGCVHNEEKRKYMLFRGFFKNFKRSRVWRTINDGNKSRIELNCAYCSCNETWDLHSAFCLRRGIGFHDDGEPVVRAYVCENGHVSGAWTDMPLYT